MRTNNDQVVLLDFGLTRSAESCEGSAAGTPLFMAPEQFQTNLSIDARTDIYSLGATLYFLTTGRFPHGAETFDELRRRVAQEPPASLLDHRPDISGEFAEIVLKAPAPAPADRFRTAGETGSR